MSNKTITQLPIVTSTTPSDKLVIVQNDVTSQISVSDLESSTIIPQLELQGRITGSAQAIANNDTGVLIQLGNTINTSNVTAGSGPFIAFLTSGTYVLDMQLTFGRNTTGGTSAISVIGQYGAAGKNLDTASLIYLHDDQQNATYNKRHIVNVTDADISSSNANYIYYMMRDSVLSSGNGLTDGGLMQIGLQEPTFNPAQALTFSIYKLIA